MKSRTSITLNPNTTHGSMKYVASLLDTKVFKDEVVGDKVEYVIGGPTLELYVASYNQTHPDTQIEYKVEEDNDYGYYIKYESNSEWESTNSITLQGDSYNEIYYSQYKGSYIAAPTQKHDYASILIVSNKLNDFNPSTMCYAKPISCLKKGVKLLENEDGTYKIL